MADLAVDNAATFLIDQPIAEGLDSRAAVVTPGRSWTYGELGALTDSVVGGLGRRGVDPEQRVALLIPEGVESAPTFLAVLKLGAVAVPLNPRATARDLGVILNDCRPKAVVAARGLRAALAPA